MWPHGAGLEFMDRESRQHGCLHPNLDLSPQSSLCAQTKRHDDIYIYIPFACRPFARGASSLTTVPYLGSRGWPQRLVSEHPQPWWSAWRLKRCSKLWPRRQYHTPSEGGERECSTLLETIYITSNHSASMGYGKLKMKLKVQAPIWTNNAWKLGGLKALWDIIMPSLIVHKKPVCICTFFKSKGVERRSALWVVTLKF